MYDQNDSQMVAIRSYMARVAIRDHNDSDRLNSSE